MLTWSKWLIIAKVGVVEKNPITRENLMVYGMTRINAAHAQQVLGAYGYLDDEKRLNKDGVAWLSNFILNNPTPPPIKK